MADLGSLAGPTGNSFAYAVNGDGSVVVGQSNTANIGFFTQADQAFRWVQSPGTNTGVMTPLGRLATNQFSAAYAVNIDGSVVVGTAGVLNGNSATQDAFRWTQATGMQSIGALPNRPFAAATSVSADGSVIVGISDPRTVVLGADGFTHTIPAGTTGPGFSATGIGAHAFRWTQATGIQDLNTLVANAGVNMGSINLVSATGVTKNGEFIVGNGFFPATGSELTGYILRYCDATTNAACAATAATVAASNGGGSTDPGTGGPSTGATGGGIGGFTTPDSVQNSVNELGDARLRLMTQQNALTAELLGANTPIGTGTEVGIYGSAGSVGAGAFGRIAFSNGFTLLSGLSYQNQHYQDVRLQDAGLGALALRYVYGASGWWRPFVEAGGWTTFDGGVNFSRNYANGVGIATGSASTSGSVSYVYGRGGAAFSIAKDEFALSAEIGRAWLRTGVYSEIMSTLNPFQGVAGSATDTLDAFKLRAQYTHVFTPKVDATVWGAAATSFGRSSPYQLAVAGLGCGHSIELRPGRVGRIRRTRRLQDHGKSHR